MIFGRKRAEHKLGLALGGAGARGISHIVFLKVLDELRVKPAAIAGTSIGAVIGVLYACGMSASGIEKLFIEMGIMGRLRLVDISLGAKEGLIKGKKIHTWLREITSGKTFSELDIPLKVVAADFWNGRAGGY